MSTALKNAALLAGTQPKAVAGPRQPWFSAISARPGALGNHDSINTAFDGDLSRLMLPLEHRITGASTLGTPTTGYLYTPETAGAYLYSYNESGWNNATNGNVGRTGATAMRVVLFQAGQGDHVAYNASSFITSTKAGSTDVLANPAVVLFNGDQAAGVDGAYLNAYETIQQDNGFDVAAAGIVNNFVRTNATGAKSAFWVGYRAQNTGTQPIDNIISAVGRARVGVDFAMVGLDFGTEKAAISLKANDRIYFNNSAVASGALRADLRTTAFNGDYLEFNSAGGFIQFVRSGTSRLQIGSTVSVNAALSVAIASVNNHANDAAAAAGGVPVGGVYRNGSALQIRVS